MIYYILRFYSQMGLWINFRKIYIEHEDRVPDEPCIIYGLNHPTAFIDPIMLGTHISEPCWYMLRGDKFVNKPVRWFLHSIRNLPIYRHRDGGTSAVKKNIQTMNFATDRLVLGEPTIILSEGLCKHERRLRPIQRGTARMMFQAWKKDKSKPVCIVPTAVNYTASNDFRSSAVISYGEPIYASSYSDAYKEDSRETIDVVTKELEERLRKLVIHVEDKKRDDLVDRVLPMVQNDFANAGFPPVSRNESYRKAQWEAVEIINGLDEVAFQSLEKEVAAYERQLQQSDVTDSGISNRQYGSFVRALLLIALGSLAIVGFILNYPPAALTQKQADEKVKNPQFYSSVRYGMGLGIYVLYISIWMIISAFLLGWFALLIPVVFPLAGYFFLSWFESFRLWKQAARIASLSDDQLAKTKTMRQAILDQLRT